MHIWGSAQETPYILNWNVVVRRAHSINRYVRVEEAKEFTFTRFVCFFNICNMYYRPWHVHLHHKNTIIRSTRVFRHLWLRCSGLRGCGFFVIWQEIIWVHPRSWQFLLSWKKRHAVNSDISNNRLGTHSYRLPLEYIFITAYRKPHHILKLTFKPRNYFRSFQTAFDPYERYLDFETGVLHSMLKPNLSNRAVWPGAHFGKNPKCEDHSLFWKIAMSENTWTSLIFGNLSKSNWLPLNTLFTARHI